MSEHVTRSLSIHISVFRDGDVRQENDAVEMPVSGVATVGGKNGFSSYRVAGHESRGIRNPAVMAMDVEGTRVSGPDLGDVRFYSKGEVKSPQKTADGFLGAGEIVYTDQYNPNGVRVPVTFDVTLDEHGIATTVRTYGHVSDFLNPSLEGPLDVTLNMDCNTPVANQWI